MALLGARPAALAVLELVAARLVASAAARLVVEPAEPAGLAAAELLAVALLGARPAERGLPDSADS